MNYNKSWDFSVVIQAILNEKLSLSTLYDSRDDLANAVKEVVSKVPFLSKYTDKEKDNLGKNSLKLFTLANFLRANRRILKDDIVTDNDRKFLFEFWSAVFNNIEEWGMLEKKQIHRFVFWAEIYSINSVTSLSVLNRPLMFL